MIRWLLALLLLALPAQAEVRLDPAGSRIEMAPPGVWARITRDTGPGAVTIRLALTQAAPYRLTLLANPPRVVVDIDGLELPEDAPPALPGAQVLPGLRWGLGPQRQGRLVADLSGPYRIASAIQRTGDPRAVTLEIALDPVDAADFEALTGTAPDPATPQDRPPGPLRVVLDPGHGGFDPGAEAGGQTEAALVLTFARELAEALRAHGIEPVMTRKDDRHLGLEERQSIARAAAADLFISLHADALPSGQAAGAAVYVWTRDADDRATEQLAARHGRDDLLSGVDLQGADDDLAGALMAVARTDTQPRSENLAQFLASGMTLSGIGMHRRPVKGAAFSVLKAPDFPSVLVELGFITDPLDRANLNDPAWRARMVRAMAQAVADWSADDRLRAERLRK